MISNQNIWRTVLCCVCCGVRVSTDVVSEFTEKSQRASPVFNDPRVDSVGSLNLLAALGDYSDISLYCKQLLDRFGDQYVAYVNCLVPAARPVKVCQNCFLSFETLNSTYANISSDHKGPGGEVCRDSLLRSDRLMLVFLLFSNLEGIWGKSNCRNCISKDAPSLTNDTLYFLEMLNQTYSCFDQYQEGNHTELCIKCKETYRDLTSLYGDMEKNNTMCIDIEDAMNVTRRRWSKTFNCSLPREENVPIIAVSSFMLFLPIIFYLSSFLHSEQKKRKLIQPKRAPQYSSLMNIQDKLS
ncbi:osteopetrosis-associated transmembrane protein 1 [Eucyclogobius newberryi]|uniref:osteopetrosis-associated transmembrane protein 1 n=1 Tax=Eucyclogobius newberryi TaxID=166745 RepID=UPI003B5B0E72